MKDPLGSSAGRERRRQAITIGIEMTAGFALICGAHYFFFGDLVLGAHPVHPFWLLIVLVPVQYGVGAGMIAASVASLVAMGGEPDLWINGEGASLLSNALATPAMWFLAAVLLGRNRDRDRAKIRSLLDDLSLERRRVHALSEFSLRLKSELAARQLKSAMRKTRTKRAGSQKKLEPSDA